MVCQCLWGKDRMPDTYRRMTGSELNIQGTKKWHTRPAFSRRTVISHRVSVLHIAHSERGWQSEGRLQLQYLRNSLCSGEVNMWRTVFETSVSAVSISRQQNYAHCTLGYEPGVISEWVQGNLLWVFCFNCMKCRDNKRYYLLNLKAYLLQCGTSNFSYIIYFNIHGTI